MSEVESARGVRLPVQVYPLFEVALRARLGLGVDEHRARIGRLWSAFSEVAAGNPHAWIQQALTPEEIAEPRRRQPDDLVPVHEAPLLEQPGRPGLGAHPLLGRGAPSGPGCPATAGCSCTPAPRPSTTGTCRTAPTCSSSPALRLAGRDAFALAGIGVDDLAHVDLYSCFPAAVQIGAIELGLVPDPQADGTGWGAIGATDPSPSPAA